MPGTTTCRSYPYPVDLDPLDVAGDIQALADAVDTDVCDVMADAVALTDQVNTNTAAIASLTAGMSVPPLPAGTIRQTIVSAPETGWLNFNQTVANAQSLYPELWAVVPAAWKSGTSLVLPDWSNRVLIGAGTVALTALGGANSRTLTGANLPVHNHNADHFHLGTTNPGTDHQHEPSVSGRSFITAVNVAGGSIDIVAGTGTTFQESFTGFEIGTNHTHGYTTPGPSGVNGVNTGNAGGGTSFDTTPACVGIIYKIKAH